MLMELFPCPGHILDTISKAPFKLENKIIIDIFDKRNRVSGIFYNCKYCSFVSRTLFISTSFLDPGLILFRRLITM